MSKRTQLASYIRPCFTISGRAYCIPYHRVVRITEGVSATANEESEEEKLRKLCGYSVNAVRLPENHEGVSATANTVSEEEKLRKLCGYSVNAVSEEEKLGVKKRLIFKLRLALITLM